MFMTVTVTVPCVAPIAGELAFRPLVSDALWDQLVGRLIRDEGYPRGYAELVQNEALGFVKYCAEHPGGGWAPSPIVDKGWHNLVLHTRAYRALCERLGTGRFIDHDPNDVRVVEVDTEAVPRTVAAMKAAGIPVRYELWPRSTACSHSGGGSGGSGCASECGNSDN